MAKAKLFPLDGVPLSTEFLYFTKKYLNYKPNLFLLLSLYQVLEMLILVLQNALNCDFFVKLMLQFFSDKPCPPNGVTVRPFYGTLMT